MQTNKKNYYVYFLKHNKLTPIKIGCTYAYSVMKRVNSYNTYSPYGVELIGYIKSEKNIENNIQKIFEKYRINAEWFEIDSKIITDFIYNYDNKIESKIYDFQKNDIKEFINTLQINTKIYNSEIEKKYNSYFKFNHNIKSILNMFKNSEVEFKKGRDNNGRYIIIC